MNKTKYEMAINTIIRYEARLEDARNALNESEKIETSEDGDLVFIPKDAYDKLLAAITI